MTTGQSSVEAGERTGDSRPIGVFDSGTGGLTVLDAMLRQRVAVNRPQVSVPDGIPDFAGERFVYFGDQANMPYGDYPGEGKADFLRGLVLNDVRFLLARNVKIVVIACNTATAYGYDAVRELLDREGGGIRLVGVVESGARDAVAAGLAAAGGGPWSVGVLATNGTVSSGIYERMIHAELARCGVTDEVRVFSRGCPGLADAVEGDDPWAHEIAGGYLRALLAEQRATAPDAPMRAIVLGCTHFPYVRGELERMAPDVAFVDPAASASFACHRALVEDGLLAGGIEPARIEAFVSVPSRQTPAACLDRHGWFSRAYKYSRSDANDGSTTIIPVREALETGALPFPRYLNALPAFSGYIRNLRETQRTLPK